MVNKPFLSIVIPALNEEDHIRITIETIREVLDKASISYEIIVIDDGSEDQTSNEAEFSGARIIRHATPEGKGSAIIDGMAISIGEFVAFIDADLEYPPGALPAILEIAQSDPFTNTCVVAERIHDKRSWWERTTSSASRKLASAVLRNGVKDTQAGLKLFPGQFARDVLTTATERGWMFDVEALLLAKNHGLKITGYPVTQKSIRPRRAGNIEIVRAGFQFLHLCATHDAMVAEAARLVKFTMVGGLNTFVDISIFLSLMLAAPPGRNVFQASGYAVIAWVFASIVGYFLHTRFTFRRMIHTVGFYTFSALGVMIQVSCVGIATHFLGTIGAIVGKLVGVILASGLTYIGFRWLADRVSNINEEII